MQRQGFASSCRAPFLAAAAQPVAAGRSDIKITDIKTYLVGVGSRNLLFA